MRKLYCQHHREKYPRKARFSEGQGVKGRPDMELGNSKGHKSNQVVNKVGARNRSNQQQLPTITLIFLESLYGQKHGMVISFRPEDERCFWEAEPGGRDRSAFLSCSRRRATENLLIAMPEALD